MSTDTSATVTSTMSSVLMLHDPLMDDKRVAVGDMEGACQLARITVVHTVMSTSRFITSLMQEIVSVSLNIFIIYLTCF